MKTFVPLLIVASVILTIPLVSGAKNLTCVICSDMSTATSCYRNKEERNCDDVVNAVHPGTKDWVCQSNRADKFHGIGTTKSCVRKTSSTVGCPVSTEEAENCYCETNLCNLDRSTIDASNNRGGGGGSDNREEGNKGESDSKKGGSGNNAMSFGGSSSWVGMLVIFLGFRQVGLFDI